MLIKKNRGEEDRLEVRDTDAFLKYLGRQQKARDEIQRQKDAQEIKIRIDSSTTVPKPFKLMAKSFKGTMTGKWINEHLDDSTIAFLDPSEHDTFGKSGIPDDGGIKRTDSFIPIGEEIQEPDSPRGD